MTTDTIENLTPLSAAGLGIVCLGVIMILVGIVMHVCDWGHGRRAKVQADGIDNEINALAKLVDSIKGTTAGVQMIVLGVVVLLIGGVMAGAATL